MTQQEASEVLGFLVAAFPDFALEERSAAVWVRLLMELSDPEAASKTALEYARQGERFPVFPDFRRSYLRLQKREQQPVEGLAALDSGPKLEAPGWVRMWRFLRATGDMRYFAEEEQASLRLGFAWPPDEGVVPQAEVDAWLRENPVDKPIDYASLPLLKSI